MLCPYRSYFPSSSNPFSASAMENSIAKAKTLMDLENPNTPLFLMASTAIVAAVVIVFAMNSGRGKKLPPGSLGLPLVGETLQFILAYRSHKGMEWVKKRVTRYGPIFKTSLIGCPTAVLTGQAGNRFLFHNDGKKIVNQVPKNFTRIFGDNMITELSGEDHKRIRGALMQFLKPEALQKFVGRIDSIVRQHFADCWAGKESLTVMPLTKKLTFQVACDLFFSLSDPQERDLLGKEFNTAVKGIWSVPLNLPGTAFHRAFEARGRVCKQIAKLIEKRRRELEEGTASASQDLMSCMITMRDEENKPLTLEEIIDNVVVVMIAGHDTTYALLTQLVRSLALHPHVYDNIVQEQTMVLEGKQSDEPLRWEDIRKMKYSWKVAQETLRLFPPIFGGFRKTVEDIEYEGYTIPKGWQLFWETSTSHRNPKVFKEPNEFDESHFDNQITSYTFTPFGGGPRICPGYDFAKIETMIFLHHLVTKWKWSLKNLDEKIICDPSPIPATGLPIKLQAK